MELALVYSLGMMGHLIPTERLEMTLDSGLEIVIAGNNDFYSQRKEVRSRLFAQNKMELDRSKSQARTDRPFLDTMSFFLLAGEPRSSSDGGFTEADPSICLYAYDFEQGQ